MAAVISGDARPGQTTIPECSDCHDAQRTLFVCTQCNNMQFCSACWPKWMLHKEGAVGWNGKPHEKTNPQVLERLSRTLKPSLSESQIAHQLQGDDDTTWFGVHRDPIGHERLEDHGRFVSLTSASGEAMRDMGHKTGQQYPELVSFIGQTGSGKSTLIKMLVERAEQYNSAFQSPPAPSKNDRVPLTGDVHLYADPVTWHTEAPRLYADCEGLEGGEALPQGLRHRGIKMEGQCGPEGLTRSFFHCEGKNKLRKNIHSTQRSIAWSENSRNKKGREYSVSQLYPRILYTFSDTVVFVLKNPRVFESTMLEKLIGWGAACVDKSINQPVLPHAIIAFNATQHVNEGEWDVEEATKLLLSDIRDAHKRVPRIGEIATMMENNGRSINSTEDILKCYYASISVVRIPAAPDYMAIEAQVEKLNDLITLKCKESHIDKDRSRMLSSSESLQIYLSAAFDHFAQRLDVPFDFIKEALNQNPIPRDFGGNILKLALAVKDHCPDRNISSRADIIFEVMTPMIASCVTLEVARTNPLGKPVDLLQSYYFEFCMDAMQRFSDTYWPCSFENRRGKCCNSKLGHSAKGHQTSDGKVIASGVYQSSFDPSKIRAEWLEFLRGMVQHMELDIDTKRSVGMGLSYVEIVSLLHRETIRHFYHQIGTAGRFRSHEICLSCLRPLPEHALYCGHVLCHACVMSFGVKTSDTEVQMRECPLHFDDYQRDPWRIQIKPRHAGARVLCLDGGSVRGIITLQVLKQLQARLGHQLPIALFFDLIVGTSVGGIISLGLGCEGWSVDECTEAFRELCRDAFAKREFHGVLGLQQLATYNHGSVYKTKPLNELLQRRFGSNGLLFGGISRGEMATKVAVTSTTSVEHRAVIFTNYNRPDETRDELPYDFKRATGPVTELKLWEVARATAAAPPYFKPFKKEETKQSFEDGAWHHNCPVLVAHHEARLIWDDMKSPDILLSIGTGVSRYKPKEQQSQGQAMWSSWSSTEKNVLRRMVWATKRHISQALDCRTIWKRFMLNNTLEQSHGEIGLRDRYIRIDPELGQELPALDDVDQMRTMELAAENYLARCPYQVEETAQRLIASTFFFEKTEGPSQNIDGTFTCTGFIRCRFADKTPEVKALGEFLKSCMVGEFEPFFFVQEQEYPQSHELRPLTRGPDDSRLDFQGSVIHEMCLKAVFSMSSFPIKTSGELSPVYITLCLRDQMDQRPTSSVVGYPISGFPRYLMSEDRNEAHGSPDMRRRVSKFPSMRRRKSSAPRMPPEPSEFLSTFQPTGRLAEDSGNEYIPSSFSQEEAGQVEALGIDFRMGSPGMSGGLPFNPRGSGMAYDMEGSFLR